MDQIVQDVVEGPSGQWVLKVAIWWGRLGLVVGKKVACRRLPLSLLLSTVLVVHFMMGSNICREGMCALAASVGGEDINLAACHTLESSRPLSQSIQ